MLQLFLSEHTNHLPKRWVDGFSDLNRIKTTDKKGLITHLESRNHKDAKAKAKMFLTRTKFLQSLHCNLKVKRKLISNFSQPQ